MELGFNLERTAHNHQGTEIWQVDFFFLCNADRAFPSVRFYTFHYPVNEKKAVRDIGEEARGKVIREFECQLRTRLTTMRRNWLPAGQTTPLVCSFFTSVCSPCEMEHTRSHKRVLPSCFFYP